MMGYVKTQYFDDMGHPYIETTLNNDPDYQDWLNDRQAEREAQENLEEMFNDLENRNG